MARNVFGLVLVAVLLAGAVARTRAADHAAAAAPVPAATPITAGNIPIIAISPELCFLLTAAKGDPVKALSCSQMDKNHFALLTIADYMGNGDGIIEPSDFAGMDVDGNQIHQMDEYGPFGWAGSLYIMAFVPNRDVVKFQTNRGVFVPPNSPPPGAPHPTTDDVAPVWICDTYSTVTGVEDPDCDPSPPTFRNDGVVVAQLRSRYGASIADRGSGTVTVTQGSPATGQGTVDFSVVGEPYTLSLTTLETTIQGGITDYAHCRLPGSAAAFLGPDGNASPQKSLVLATAKDIDGTAITGAIVNWTTDDFNKARMAAAIAPTIDLGSFGFGALNIICGGATTGTVTVSARTSPDVVAMGIIVTDVDPQASVSLATTTFTVIDVPASATFGIIPPVGAQPLNMPFQVTANLVALASTAAVPGWSGYDLDIAYDASIIKITGVVPTLCQPAPSWANATITPRLVTSCYAQARTSTGVLETITAICLRDGTSAFHMVTPNDPVAVAAGEAGTTLLQLDVSASPFSMTLQDASVTCDRASPLGDQDGDGCANGKELLLGLDPSNPWDFYSVPVPALFALSSPAGVIRDSAVTVRDAQSVFAYFIRGAVTGTLLYDQDLNGNGIADGKEYDRSILGAGQSGPPDGIVSAADAQLAFTQLMLRYRC